jgi:hypothetical protein
MRLVAVNSVYSGKHYPCATETSLHHAANQPQTGLRTNGDGCECELQYELPGSLTESLGLTLRID